MSADWRSLPPLRDKARCAELKVIEEKAREAGNRIQLERRRRQLAHESAILNDSQRSIESGEIFDDDDDDNYSGGGAGGGDASVALMQRFKNQGQPSSPGPQQPLVLQQMKGEDQALFSGVPTQPSARIIAPVQKASSGAGSFTSPPKRKRPQVSSAYADDRRTSTIRKTKPKPTIESSPYPPSSLYLTTNAAESSVGDTLEPPKWYKDTKKDPSKRPAGGSTNDALLRTLDDGIVNISKGALPAELNTRLNSIRSTLHKLMFAQVNPQLLRNRKALDPDGLPRLFADTGVAWPWDIKADAKELYNKWCREDFDTHLLRGIVMTGKQGKLDPGWDKLPAKFHGNGDLLNGQWWPTRLAVLRDGAHGETQAGISGAPNKGAFSCVMSGGADAERKEYPDQDRGDCVLYCGTDSQNGEITAATQRLIESVGNKEPIRLIRSSNVKSSFAPELGYRYDGLYECVSVEELGPDFATRRRHRFKLQRCPGQDPIRGGPGPEKRPTAEEIEAWTEDSKMYKGTKTMI